MEFRPEDIGPYDPYMDFLLENIGRKTQKRPSEEKLGRKIPKFKFSQKIQNFKMVISAVSMRPKIKILGIPKNSFLIRCFINT